MKHRAWRFWWRERRCWRVVPRHRRSTRHRGGWARIILIDATADTTGPATLARRLVSAGLARADGFTPNVGRYVPPRTGRQAEDVDPGGGEEADGSERLPGAGRQRPQRGVRRVRVQPRGGTANVTIIERWRAR